MLFRSDLTGRLHLPVETRRPVRIEVLVNLPRSRSAGEYYRQCMSALLAQMKVLSGVELGNGSMNITLLDVQHRRAVVLSRHGRALDWSELKAALEKANPNVIDVRQLGTHGEEAEFLAAEVRRRLQQDYAADERRADPLPILIFLSAPAMLGKEAGKPVPLGEFHEGSAYLVRYHPPVALQEMLNGSPASLAEVDSMPDSDVGGRRLGGAPRMPPMPNPPQGQLNEKVIPLQEILKSLKPRIFDVNNPLQFREALAAILEDISRM